MAESEKKTYKELEEELEQLRQKYSEAEDVINAIKTGGVDALAIQMNNETRIFSLEGSDHNYRVFIEEMNEGAITLNQKGDILYCNSRFADMVNNPLEKVIGCAIGNFVNKASKVKMKNLLEKGWEGSSRGEISLNGTEYLLPVQISIKTLNIEDFKAMYMVVSDISERIDAEKQLIQKNDELQNSNSDLEQFAYVASHDLKEPLRMIGSFSGLLIQKTKNASEEIKEYGEFISEGVARMQGLIQDLLAYARIGHNEVEMSTVNTNDTVSQAVMMLKNKIEETGTEIKCQNLPLVFGNPVLLRTVFQNLIDNAVKFRKQDTKPVIEIDVVKKEEFWEFSFKDNGIGFDPQYGERIFVIFQRLHTREKYLGSGIGLSICKKIIGFHGGKMWIESKEGEGSVFLFTLPTMEAENIA